jgi:hypothetical protein
MARLLEYDKANRPLLRYYQASDLLHTFQGDSSDAIYPRFRTLVESMLQNKKSSK